MNKMKYIILHENLGNSQVETNSEKLYVTNNIDQACKECETGSILIYHKSSYQNIENQRKEGVEYIPVSGSNDEDRKFISNVKDHLEKNNIKECIDTIKQFCSPRVLSIVISNILDPLIPLHLSLQAFFGISRGENGNWFYFGKDKEYTNEFQELGLIKVDIELKDYFPNDEAFRLVEEAGWDFYAPIFDKVMPENLEQSNYAFNSDEEKEDYNKSKNIGSLLGNFLERSEVDNVRRTIIESIKQIFENQYGYEENSKEIFSFKLNKNEEVSYAKFIKCLREISAILANSDPNQCKNDSGKTFGYKGGLNPGQILDKLKNIKNAPHCKLQNNNSYQNLVSQIKSWGIKKAMIVIAGIEEFAKLLLDDYNES